jgi:hypothetical protein
MGESRADTGPAAGRDERPVFFIHVMKTGGTTVFRNLRANYALDELYPYRKLDIQFDGPRVDVRHHLSVPYLVGLAPERHRRIRVYTGHFPLVVTELLGGRFTTVTLLRDPVERTISLLRQFRRKAEWLDPDQPYMASQSVEEVYADPIVFEPLIHNHQTKIFSMRASDAPDSYMDVIDVDRSRLAIAKDNLERIDVLGLTERYDDFLDEVAARFGWDVERDARANATPADDIQPVGESLRRQIAVDNALDVELYEHAQQLLDLRRSRRPIDV